MTIPNARKSTTANGKTNNSLSRFIYGCTYSINGTWSTAIIATVTQNQTSCQSRLRAWMIRPTTNPPIPTGTPQPGSQCSRETAAIAHVTSARCTGQLPLEPLCAIFSVMCSRRCAQPSRHQWLWPLGFSHTLILSSKNKPASSASYPEARQTLRLPPSPPHPSCSSSPTRERAGPGQVPPVWGCSKIPAGHSTPSTIGALTWSRRITPRIAGLSATLL